MSTNTHSPGDLLKTGGLAVSRIASDGDYQHYLMPCWLVLLPRRCGHMRPAAGLLSAMGARLLQSYRHTDSHSAANTKVKVDNSHNSHARYLVTTRCDSVVFYSEFPATLSPPRSSAPILSEHVYVLTADLLSGSRLGAALGAAPPRQPPTAGKSVQKRQYCSSSAVDMVGSNT